MTKVTMIERLIILMTVIGCKMVVRVVKMVKIIKRGRHRNSRASQIVRLRWIWKVTNVTGDVT